MQAVPLRKHGRRAVPDPGTPQPVQDALLLPDSRRTHQGRCRTPPPTQERRFADQIDRDYEILNHNYHPVQLYTYELLNKQIRRQNEAADAAEKGEKTFDQAFCEEVEYALPYSGSRSRT